MLIGLSLTLAFGSCHIYKSYERPEGVSASDSLYRQPVANGDTTSLASLSWKELFADPLLQQHIDSGLKNNADMRIALLKVKEAEAALLSSKMTYLPSLSLGADGTVGQFKGESTPKSYSLAMSASWEIDLFGKILNEKRGAEAVLWQNTSYSQAVQTQLIATIANSYYMLLMLDEQLAISRRTSENWSDYVRTLQALKTFGTVNDAAIAQAEASQLSLEGSVLSLQQQIQSVENSLSVLLGKVPGRIERTSLDEQTGGSHARTGLLRHKCCTRSVLSQHLAQRNGRLDQQRRSGYRQSGRMAAQCRRLAAATHFQPRTKYCQPENSESATGRSAYRLPAKHS